MKKAIVCVLLIAFVIVGSSGLIQAQEYSWRMGWNTAGQDTPRAAFAEAFTRVMEEETDGNVTIRHYPDETLGSEAEMSEMVQAGALEFMIMGSGVLQADIPEFAVGTMPFVFENFEEAHAVLDGPVGQALKEKAHDINLHLVDYGELGMVDITNNVRPIEHPDDMDGLVIRTPEEPAQVATFQALGASVSTMPFAEVYLALEQGVVDGQFNPINAIFETNFHEVQDYLANVNMIYYWTQLAVNLEWWEDLEPEMQDIINKAAEAGKEASREFYAETEEYYYGMAEDHFEVITRPEIEPFREAVQPAIDEFYRDRAGEFVDMFYDAAAEFRESNN